MARSGAVAVLTGDLIGSTKASAAEVDRSFVILESAAGDIAEWAGGDTRLTRFRGDGWQMLINKPDLALRAATILLARMRAPDSPLQTRIAIGIGQIDSPGSQDLSDASGDAFTRSGRALDAARHSEHLETSAQGTTFLHKGFTILAEAIIRRWTPEQAEAIGLYLHPDDPILKEIAAKLAITIQAASYRIRGGSGNDFRRALSAWELAARVASAKDVS